MNDALGSNMGCADHYSISGNHPFRMEVPARARHMICCANVPTELTYLGETSNLFFCWKKDRPRFDYDDWKQYVQKHNLKCDDAIVFEVLEFTYTILRLKLVILRDTNWVLTELQAKIDAAEKTLETAIDVD